MRPEIKPVMGPEGPLRLAGVYQSLAGASAHLPVPSRASVDGKHQKAIYGWHQPPGFNFPAPNSHGWVALNVVRYGEWDLTSFGGWHPRPPNAHPDLPGN